MFTRMHVYEHMDTFKKPRNAIVSMGIFDGMHRGHQQLLGQLYRSAKATDGETVIITFWPHPRLVLAPNNTALQLLTTLEDKLARLASLGIDHVIKLSFTKEFSQLSAQDFIKQVLVERIGTKKLIIGHNHRFGKGGAGDIHLLQKVRSNYGFQVREVAPFMIEATTVSATKIRQLLHMGQVEKAAIYLGRPYAIWLHVHTKKVATNANYHYLVSPCHEDNLIPATGSYAVQVQQQHMHVHGVLYLTRSVHSTVITLEVSTRHTTLQPAHICVRFISAINKHTSSIL